MMRKQAVIFVADDNYILQFLVTLQSLLKTNPQIQFTPYLITCKLSDTSKQMLRNWEHDKGFVIHILYVNIQELDWLKPMERAWSRFMFLKLYIPYLLPADLKSVLYLDVDLLVVDKIDDLLNVNLKDYALAGVEDVPGCIQHKKRCSIPPESIYINSGVMYINLNIWREAAKSNLFWQFIRDNSAKYVINDQDVINSVFQMKILPLPLKYNVTNHCYGFRPNVLPVHRMQLKEVYHYPVIIHFTNWNKPWFKENYHLFKKSWWHECKEVSHICHLPISKIYSKNNGLRQRLINAFKFMLWRVFIVLKY